MAKQLLVIDGADRGRGFPLPGSGAVSIGSSRRNADICLHDPLVRPVHCLVEVDGSRIVVRSSDDAPDLVVNGHPTRERALRPGDVLRVGNSHLRVEGRAVEPAGAAGREEPAPAGEEPGDLARMPAELTGRAIGHYEIGPVLGGGPRSVVFRAQDRKAGRVVALKVFPPEFPRNAAEMRRFVRALKGVVGLRHPHLVTLHNAGRTGPYCWLALEHVEGESLAQLLARGGADNKPDWRQALRLGVHVGRALSFAHGHRLLHGNITPQSILVRAADQAVKLGDLMLARALAGSALHAATLEAKLLAELPYLPPEVANPNASVDRLSDIYGLGAVLYTRLTGRPPFQGDSPDETLALIDEGAVVKPRQRQPSSPQTPEEDHWLLSETLNWARQRQSSIPQALEGAVMRMLARRPEDRYPTAAELVADLERIADREKVKV
jgi:serine/threonine protein kinase